MAAHLRNGVRAGLIFGIVIVFLVLIGFILTATRYLQQFLKLDVLNSFATFLALLGIWGGITAAKPTERDTWLGALASGLSGGLISGVLVGIFTLIVGSQVDAGVNLRRYLVSLSPEAVNLLRFDRATGPGALMLLGILIAASLVGAILARGVGRGEWRRPVGDRWAAIRESVGQVPLVRTVLRSPVSQYVAFIAILAFVLWLPTRLTQAWDYNMGTIAIYVLLGLGLNIVVGLAGLLDLGYVAFFAVGAYTVALLTGPQPHGIMWNFWLVVPLGVALAALAGVLLGIPVLRLRGDYLAIVTLGFGEIIRILAGSDALTPFSGGPMGVVGVPLPSFFGLKLGFEEFIYLLIAGVLLVIFVTARLQNSRIGRAWIAMREDETVARAMGINTLTYKLLAFGIGASFAGLGGALFAARNQFTNPQDHTLLVSINVLAVVIVGGMGSIPGVILGAFVLKGIPEILREFENYRIIIFAALLVVMMILRPEGILPSRRRRLEIHAEATELEELTSAAG